MKRANNSWTVRMVFRSVAIAGVICAGFDESVSSQTSIRPPNTFRAPITQNTAPAAPSELHPDRTVTFRLSAPNAARVELVVGLAQPLPMKKGADGVWTVTLGPLDPEIYEYNFIVDGVSVTDPSNPTITIGRSSHSSVLDVPGASPRFDQRQEVPQGLLQTRTYFSTIVRLPRQMVVYLPPQYVEDSKRRFPVLYLRHGNGGLEGSWNDAGRAGIILDNLIAQREAVPMIIVMPNGYPARGPGSTPEGIAETGRELLDDVIPFVERSYRVIANADNRAIAGLSMGAGQAFITGLNHLDKFAWVGAFSSGVVSDADFRLAVAVPGFLGNSSLVNKRLRLLFISCGTEDPRLPGSLDLVDLLKQNNIQHEWYSTPGAHEWKVWRHSLAAMLPKLFQPSKVLSHSR